MEGAIYPWKCNQIQNYQPAYDIKELSADKNEKEKEITVTGESDTKDIKKQQP